MVPPNERSGNGSAGAAQLRIHRIDAGVASVVWFLAFAGLGVFTHYLKRRSQLCPGRECCCGHQREERIWKGYEPVLIHQRDTGLWLATVLELTEGAELQLRGNCGRGHVWQLSRAPDQKGKRNPVSCRLVELQADAITPAAFDIQSCLRHLYHRDHVDASFPNPMPLRALATEYQLPSPSFPQNPESKPIPDADERLKMKTLFEQLRERSRRANGGGA